MEEEKRYWEGCYVSEERWLKYCKGNKRKTYCGLPAMIIINEHKVMTTQDYWDHIDKKGE